MAENKEENSGVEMKQWLRSARYKTMAKRSPRGRRPKVISTEQPESPQLTPKSPQPAAQSSVPPEPMAKPPRQPICVWCKKRHLVDQCLRGAQQCFRCGGIGHDTRDCPRKRPHVPTVRKFQRMLEVRRKAAGGTTSKPDPHPICGKCGFRHKAVQCFRGTNRCFGCGEDGHFVRDCSKKKIG